MKKIFTLIFALAFVFLGFNLSYAQTDSEIREILKHTNVAELKKIAAQYNLIYSEKHQAALKIAAEKGWIIRREIDGGVMALQIIDDNGFPVYYTTYNVNAAKTTSTDKVHSGGGMGLSLDGTNLKVGVWDGGNVLVTHQEFNNTGTPRVNNINTTPTSGHATHVTGTILAGGAYALAKGMAFNATADAYEFGNDIGEMSAAIANGLIISNHSYGQNAGWFWNDSEWEWHGDLSLSTVEDYKFGFYGSRAYDFDNITYNAPYYLVVNASGNSAGIGPASQPVSHKVWDGNNWVTSTDVRDINGGATGFKTIAGFSVSKNILTVGGVKDITSGYAQPSDVIIESWSSRGPTDDGRIKPDIVGNGAELISSDANHNTHYTSKSGTSMAAPNVTGSLMLLQQHHNQLHNHYMKAASLKALAIHTADEAGVSEGPDYVYGWGLLNTAKAADLITNKHSKSIFKEDVLINGDTYTINVNATGTEPLIATLVWADPPATPLSPQLNPTSSMLINDLDIRIVRNATNYYPYVLDGQNPSNPATKGVNSVDNVEKVFIANPPAGNYSVVITHKGTITNNTQEFSLIVTGVLNSFPVVSTGNISNITLTSAVVNGQVVADNGNTVTERGFVYNITGNPTTANNKVIVGAGTGNFSTTLSGLTSNTTYYVKAYATNSAGTDYGVQKIFSTLCDKIASFPNLENFNASSSVPNCWEVVDNSGGNNTWHFGTVSNGLSGTTGNYAYTESTGQAGSYNLDLVSPTYDFSGLNRVKLSFKHYFRHYPGSTARLFYSTNNGGSWTQLDQWTNITTANPESFSRALNFLAGEQQVKFKWNYTGTQLFYWFVDDVSVEAVFCDKISTFPFLENFNASSSLPNCWEVVDNQGTGKTWHVGTLANGLANTTGNYAYVSNATNLALITPAFNFSGYKDVVISFAHYFRYFPNSSAKLFYSLDNGLNWTSIQEWQGPTTANPELFSKHVPALENQSNVLFSLNYTGGSASFYWMVDDLEVRANSISNIDEQFVNTTLAKVYSYDGYIFVEDVTDVNAILHIYNLLGQEVMTEQLTHEALNVFNSKLASGHYIAKVISNSGMLTKKIYIH